MDLWEKYLGKAVNVQIDRPLGSRHPKHGFIYEVNYGYIPNTISGDGEELDAYVLGINSPITEFTGKCIAVIHRTNDNDDKLIVVPQNLLLSHQEIEKQICFQEKWFTHKLIHLYPTIHLICGYLGFGKTTYAKQLEQDLTAVRFTHDEIMCNRYGRNPDNFQEKYKVVDKFIRQQTIIKIKEGYDVILDYGFWTRENRKQYYNWAKKITPNVIFHALTCDINIARERINQRTNNQSNELFIDENCFNKFLKS